MVLETLIKLWITKLDFMEKLFGHKNMGDGPETGIFEFIDLLVLDTNPEKLKIDQKCLSWV